MSYERLAMEFEMLQVKYNELFRLYMTLLQVQGGKDNDTHTRPDRRITENEAITEAERSI